VTAAYNNVAFKVAAKPLQIETSDMVTFDSLQKVATACVYKCTVANFLRRTV